MKKMEAKYNGVCEFCGLSFQKGNKIIGLGFDSKNNSRGYMHLVCWENYPNQQYYRAEDKPKNKTLPDAVKAGHHDLYGQTCACGCGQFFHSNCWVVMHPVPDDKRGEWLYWRCSAHRLWHYANSLGLLVHEGDEEESTGMPILRTTTDTLKHS